METRCNNCWWEGLESDLVLLGDGPEWFKGCPNCLDDGYLIDIEEEVDSIARNGVKTVN